MRNLLTLTTVGLLAMSFSWISSAVTAQSPAPSPSGPAASAAGPEPALGTAAGSSERLPFVAVNQLLTEVVRRFSEGPGCDGAGDAGGHVNVIHRTAEGPRFFKAWILGDRFVVARYRERPQSEPPAERPAVAWMGQIAQDGRLQVRTTVEGGAFGEACAWLLGRDV